MLSPGASATLYFVGTIQQRVWLICLICLARTSLYKIRLKQLEFRRVRGKEQRNEERSGVTFEDSVSSRSKEQGL
ncbi:hypothetical protein DE146DRAFT_638574 [Phaeosphaeria sp. MPI-PUGE-AT-0046c]|nr:hypothetical protein DE146DRAFT_638574 [Phaeosphaeria sp. MPI-PUGE-AT-0046c]